MIKIAFYDTKGYDIPAMEEFGKKRNIEFKFFESRLNPDTAHLAKGYDGVCVFVNDVVSKEVIDILYSYGIRFIALRCAGFNNVDTKAAFGKIHIYRVPAYSPYAVAEHAMALLLTSNRRIHKAYIRTRDYNFSLNELTGVDLYNKTMGVIGTGKIGQVFINICKGFGMKIIAYDKFPNPNLDIEYVELDELFKRSDFISLHCPLTDENKHLINKETIGLMKKGVGIINTSRGGLIDGQALLDGIKERKIGFACLDVYEEEGELFYEDKSGHILDDDTLRSLLSMPNVIITSHQAFLTKEALTNIADTTTQNIQNYFENGDNENEVCYHCNNINNCRKERKLKCF
jgi:D-lactate dehydrogenase